MKILILDSNVLPEYWGCHDIRRLPVFKKNEVIVIKPQHGIPNVDYSHAILSGSLTDGYSDEPWVLNTIAWIQNQEKPMYGICFGHQLIARAFGARVGLCEKKEYGMIEIEDELFYGEKRKFFAPQFHKDEVKEMPKSFVQTGTNSNCKIQSMKHHSKPIFSTQFHPEKTLLELQSQKEDFENKEHIRDFTQDYENFILRFLVPSD